MKQYTEIEIQSSIRLSLVAFGSTPPYKRMLYDDLHKRLPGVDWDRLILSLKKMEKDGLIESYSRYDKTFYGLTPAGGELHVDDAPIWTKGENFGLSQTYANSLRKAGHILLGNHRKNNQDSPMIECAVCHSVRYVDYACSNCDRLNLHKKFIDLRMQIAKAISGLQSLDIFEAAPGLEADRVRDTDRMDWFEREMLALQIDHRQGVKGTRWALRYDPKVVGVEQEWNFYPTIREAIDSCRQLSPPAEGERPKASDDIESHIVGNGSE